MVSVALVSNMAFAEATCGDGICEAEGAENSCICPQDCGSCEGPAPNAVCKEFACVNNICLPKLTQNCCGNDSCEVDESYGTCSVDCEPTSLELEILFPQENETFFLGEKVYLRVQATSSGRNAASADLNVSSFFGFLRLFNDGKHEDDGSYDKFFANSFFLTDVNSGIFDLNFQGSFHGISATTTRKINIETSLRTELEIKSKFKRGQTIWGKGRILKRTEPISSFLNIQLFAGNEKTFEIWTQSGSDGFFDFQYQSSLIDALGEWTARVSGQDSNQNKIWTEKQFLLLDETSRDELFVETVNKLSSELRRGEKLELFVEVKNDENSLINDANVFLETPFAEKVKFDRIQGGTYAVFYSIPSALQLGKQIFRVVASKETADYSAEGQLLVIQKITSALLDIKILEPSANYYRVGDTMPVLIKVSYSDQQPVISGNAKLRIKDKEFLLEPVEEGLYRTEIKISETDYGEPDLFFNITDEFGNDSFIQKKITVAQKTIFFELLENPVVTVIILGVLIGIGFIVFMPFFVLFSAYDLREKRKKLLQQKELLQKQYFSQNIIDKNAYESRLREYENKLEKIEEHLKKMKK
ncbi:MAG: hypothetical protein HY392_00465 [Candidatus Diapherotrites archaeon]|nr:hypothetical protein [Candidatus Diapherotrites archaeon]